MRREDLQSSTELEHSILGVQIEQNEFYSNMVGFGNFVRTIHQQRQRLQFRLPNRYRVEEVYRAPPWNN